MNRSSIALLLSVEGSYTRLNDDWVLSNEQGG